MASYRRKGQRVSELDASVAAWWEYLSRWLQGGHTEAVLALLHDAGAEGASSSGSDGSSALRLESLLEETRKLQLTQAILQSPRYRGVVRGLGSGTVGIV